MITHTVICIKNMESQNVLSLKASDGIGLAYCKEFARHGFNIIMVSRNKERLEVA